ncbi:MAG: tryptophan--tRNA ligase [Cyanobacteriota/Melainabacteria group bacterium]|nr:tryptophan--tRNA ligase [Cyanobacteria bacterium HKST-UBA01]MCB9467933.1 tryptophan--tRNA ligase [Candidatus Obscuribacterales bacterium]
MTQAETAKRQAKESNTRKRIMSGMRPTGRLHIGHYLGVLTNWVQFQSDYESFFSIVDWHALTTKYMQTENIQQDVFEVALDWLSVGIDPEVATIYVQSGVPEIAELHLLLSMITKQNWVEREPTLKDMIRMLAQDEKEAQDRCTYGLIGYPVLMSADILAFKGELIPVGKDQESHLEFARDLARRFNSIYKVDYFPEPKPRFTETPLLKGVDGQKMGKSYGNDIKIADTEEDTKKQVKKMITDRTRIAKSDPGHTDLCEVPWPYYNIFAKASTEQVKDECESAKIGCVDCKMRLADHINDYFRPVRERRRELAEDPRRVMEILEAGNLKARETAKQTLSDVREIMGLTNWKRQ